MGGFRNLFSKPFSLFFFFWEAISSNFFLFFLASFFLSGVYVIIYGSGNTTEGKGGKPEKEATNEVLLGACGGNLCGGNATERKRNMGTVSGPGNRGPGEDGEKNKA